MDPKFSLLLLSGLFWPLVAPQLSHDVLAAGEKLGTVLGHLHPSMTVPGEVSPVAASEPSRHAAETVAVDSGSELRPKPRKSKRFRAKRVVPKQGIRVGRMTVLRLANAGAMPVGKLVSGSGRRPAGILLSGVSALGVGVRDGDVLTSVAGQAVTTRAQVVSQVLSARARRAPEVSAVFYRAGQPWRLIVEMPYVKN